MKATYSLRNVPNIPSNFVYFIYKTSNRYSVKCSPGVRRVSITNKKKDRKLWQGYELVARNANINKKVAQVTM